MAVMESEGKKTEEARKLKQQLDLKEHEIKLSEEQINSNSHSRVHSASNGVDDRLLPKFRG